MRSEYPFGIFKLFLEKQHSLMKKQFCRLCFIISIKWLCLTSRLYQSPNQASSHIKGVALFSQPSTADKRELGCTRVTSNYENIDASIKIRISRCDSNKATGNSSLSQPFPNQAEKSQREGKLISTLFLAWNRYFNKNWRH